MSAVDIADAVMSELVWINMWLLILTVVLGAGVWELGHRIKKQEKLIDDLLYELETRNHFDRM